MPGDDFLIRGGEETYAVILAASRHNVSDAGHATPFKIAALNIQEPFS